MTGGTRSGRAGMALVLVLWVITLLTVIAASFSLGVRRDAGLAHHLTQAAVAEAAAEAGLRLAMLGLSNPDPNQRWNSGDGVRSLSWQGVQLEVSVVAETGRVDLNHAGAALLDGLLAAVGVEDPARREGIVAQIRDWRDTAAGTRPQGLSPADYRALGYPYGPANSPFRATEELLLLSGVDPDLFRRLQPLVTTYSGQPDVDPRHAPFEVLLALPGMDAAAARTLLEEREAAGERLVANDSDVHTVISVAHVPSGARAGVRAVLRTSDEQDAEPFRIVHFRPAR